MASKLLYTFVLLTALTGSPSLYSPLSFVKAAHVQHSQLALPASSSQHRDMVRQVFVESYSAYRRIAFGHDSLAPVTQSWIDDRNGWGASIIDAMSTMHIMGLDSFFDEAVHFATNVDFTRSRTPGDVSVFETTIRYVGGLLSAYELTGGATPGLLAQAKILGDKLALAWDEGRDIPWSHIDFTSDTPRRGPISNIAEAGTLTLEFGMLSKYTGNDTYRALADRAAKHIATGGAPLPGLPAQGINPATGYPVGSYVTWGGGSDSYFEYLIKYPRFDFSVSPVYADSWRTAVDNSIKTLLKYSTQGSWAYLAAFDASVTQSIEHVSSHLACFHGGNWLLGGRMLGNDTIVEYGLQLTDACWNTYASTVTGIGPEEVGFISSDGGYTGGPPLAPDQKSFNAQHGFYILDSAFDLRPEVLESNFYAWRVTGDTKYYDRAVLALGNFIKYLPVEGDRSSGYSGLRDVMDTTVEGSRGGRMNRTESFWFAELLKYLYLTFDDPAHISLDEYVFNTEAHPFRVPAGAETTTYGSGKPYVPTKSFVTTKGALPQVSGLPNGKLIANALSLLNGPRSIIGDRTPS